jgi:putative tricarboxylic transport membrane protein
MIMRVPYAIITPFIVIISVIGSYSLNNSMLDVFITVIFGLVGYWLRKLKYPLAPLVVALVLGDSAERTFRQGLVTAAGNPLIFAGTPLAAGLLLLGVIFLLLPLIQYIRQRRAAPVTAGVEDPRA